MSADTAATHAQMVREALYEYDGYTAHDPTQPAKEPLAALVALAEQLQRERDEAREAVFEEAGETVIEIELRKAAEAQAETYREALRWYADKENHTLSLQDVARGRNTRVVDDNGHRARAVLAGHAPEPAQEERA